jgi:hypothetical protein
MLQALAEGKDTAQEVAQLAKKQLRKKIPELQLALEGKMESPPFLVEKDLGFVEQRIQEKQLKPYAIEITLLDEIPGVDATLAGAINRRTGCRHECVRECFPSRLLGERLSGQQ